MIQEEIMPKGITHIILQQNALIVVSAYRGSIYFHPAEFHMKWLWDSLEFRVN
jgi:hypothetical protein